MQYPRTADPPAMSPSCQLDFFQEVIPEKEKPVKTNPNYTKTPESLKWSDAAIEQLEDAAIAEAWPDFIDMVVNRLKIPGIPLECINEKDLPNAISLHDYQTTLGWVLRLWVGHISLDAVLAYENELCDKEEKALAGSDKAILKVLNSHPVLQQDCRDLKVMYLHGGALFAPQECNLG